MTYVIAEPCIDVKDRACVDVCPVDCIHEVGRMLVIDPEECIDCGACEPECPVEAIFPEDALPDKWAEFTRINAAYLEGAEVVDELVEDYCAATSCRRSRDTADAPLDLCATLKLPDDSARIVPDGSPYALEDGCSHDDGPLCEADLDVALGRRRRPATTPKEAPMSTSSEQILDVRSEPPARRHALIFDTYHELRPGDGFVLVNDHDPKPLRYQFEAEHAGAYSWDYLEQGPEVWRVRIGRPAA